MYSHDNLLCHRKQRTSLCIFRMIYIEMFHLHILSFSQNIQVKMLKLLPLRIHKYDRYHRKCKDPTFCTACHVRIFVQVKFQDFQNHLDVFFLFNKKLIFLNMLINSKTVYLGFLSKRILLTSNVFCRRFNACCHGRRRWHCVDV